MEKSLEKQLEETFRIPGVVGVMCVDNNGLCLGTKGTVCSNSSGSISALAIQAAKLSSNNLSPVICLESEHGSVLIKKMEKVTTAIFKSS